MIENIRIPGYYFSIHIGSSFLNSLLQMNRLVFQISNLVVPLEASNENRFHHCVGIKLIDDIVNYGTTTTWHSSPDTNSVLTMVSNCQPHSSNGERVDLQIGFWISTMLWTTQIGFDPSIFRNCSMSGICKTIMSPWPPQAGKYPRKETKGELPR